MVGIGEIIKTFFKKNNHYSQLLSTSERSLSTRGSLLTPPFIFTNTKLPFHFRHYGMYLFEMNVDEENIFIDEISHQKIMSLYPPTVLDPSKGLGSNYIEKNRKYFSFNFIKERISFYFYLTPDGMVDFFLQKEIGIDREGIFIDNY